MTFLKKLKRINFVMVATTVGVTAPFAAGSSFAKASSFDANLYKKLNPLSIKYCAMSQVSRIGRKPGDTFGHAVLWLEDVCLDQHAQYPKLRRCNGGDQVKGVGLSVNKTFSSVNWVATPGHDLFFYGDAPANGPIDENAKNKLIEKVTRLGLFAGVQFRSEWMATKPADMSALEFGIDNSLDTDLAVNWGRDLYCVNIPVNASMLDRAMTYANLTNARYSSAHDFDQISASLTQQERRDFEIKAGATVNGYRFNGMTDNCTHFAYNLIAATGIVPKKKIGGMPGKGLAVPSDILVYLFDQGSAELPAQLSALQAVYQNPDSRDLLTKDNWVFPHDGVVMEVIPMHVVGNSLFTRTGVLKTLGGKNKAEFNRITTDVRLQDVKANLSDASASYSFASTQLAVELQKKSGSLSDDFAGFARQFMTYLNEQMARVHRPLPH